MYGASRRAGCDAWVFFFCFVFVSSFGPFAVFSLCKLLHRTRKVQIRQCRQTARWKLTGGWRDAMPGCPSSDLPELVTDCWAGWDGMPELQQKNKWRRRRVRALFWAGKVSDLFLFPPEPPTGIHLHPSTDTARTEAETWTELPRASNPSLGGLRAAGARVASAALWAPLIPRRRLGGCLCLRPPKQMDPSPGCGRVWGALPCPGSTWQSRLPGLLSVFGSCPARFCAFPPPKRPSAAWQAPGRGSKTQSRNPRTSISALPARCAQAGQPRRVPRAAVLGSSRTDKAPSRPREALLAPAAWRRMPACKKQDAPSTPLPRPTWLCSGSGPPRVTYHMEDGGRRWEVEGGKWRLGGWSAGF